MLGINDIIHGWISFSKFEKAIIDSPLFQRLRHVKQASTSFFVYPDATHTRFSHSLGAMFLSAEYANTLKLSDNRIKKLRIASLLHDIAHGPFSHSFDETVYKRIYCDSLKGHDEHRNKILRSKTMLALLNDAEVSPEDITDIWSGKDKLCFSILSGPLGSDRMDYISRDSYFCGMKYPVDIRILKNVSSNSDGNLIYPEKLAIQIQMFLLHRMELYLNVYYHKVTISYNEVLIKILNIACDTTDIVEKVKDIDNSFCSLTDSILFGIPGVKKEIKCLVERNAPKLDCIMILSKRNEIPTFPTNFIVRQIDPLDIKEFQDCNILFKLETGGLESASKFLIEKGFVKNEIVLCVFKQ